MRRNGDFLKVEIPVSLFNNSKYGPREYSSNRVANLSSGDVQSALGHIGTNVDPYRINSPCLRGRADMDIEGLGHRKKENGHLGEIKKIFAPSKGVGLVY